MKSGILILIAAMLGGCALSQPAEKTLYIASALVPCVGVGPQTCLEVREHPDDPWRLLYQGVEGFTYEEGYFYRLRVREERVPNPPADGSSIRLVLLAVVSRIPAEVAGSSWRRLAFGPPDALQTVLDAAEITLAFSQDGRLGGSSGCNTYGANVVVIGERIALSLIAGTLMACAEAVMAQERAYLAALQRVTGLELAGAELRLLGEGVRLVYRPD